MPSLRTKIPGYPRYSGRLSQTLRSGGGYAPNVLGLNPVAYWPFIESAGVNASDLSGNSLTATYTNCTLANLAGPGASMGMAPYFNGTTSFVQLPAAGLNSVFNPLLVTISLWFYLNESWGAGVRCMAQAGVDASNRLLLYKNGTFPTVYRAAGGSNNQINLSAPAAGWHHLLTTIDKGANQHYSYLDGAATGPTTTPGTWAGTLANSWSQIGAVGGSSNWLGWLQHIVLFNRVVSSAERAILATAA